jgi:hypothetical protein
LNIAQHLFRHVEVGNHAVLHGAYGEHAVRRATEHAFRFEPHALDLLGFAVERDDRRLVEDDALAFHVDERVGRPEIDGNRIGRKQRSFLEERPAHGQIYVYRTGTEARAAGSRVGRGET